MGNPILMVKFQKCLEKMPFMASLHIPRDPIFSLINQSFSKHVKYSIHVIKFKLALQTNLSTGNSMVTLKFCYFHRNTCIITSRHP